ncbi:MAG: hypothetical protein JSW50_07730 [Candidatus Latescibacterota bacterium]|nr:MAG: hypothetical protein JSW50_07730 [Candidatus Latescibacterota bacterium]
MSDHFHSTSARIRALKTSIVSLLESERETGVPMDKVNQSKDLLVEAYQKFLNDGASRLLKETFAGSEEFIHVIEEAYADWRDVDNAFQETLAMAYQGVVSRQNLLLDDIHNELRTRVGDPTAAFYSRVHLRWQRHLDSHPWDAHLTNTLRHADAERLYTSLDSLVHGDNFDVEDAVETLAGPLRYAFANYLEKPEDSADLLEESLWMRPEIIVMNDFWRYHPRVRLLDLLATKGPRRFTGVFAKVQDFFTDQEAANVSDTPTRIVNEVKSAYGDDKDTYLRCLMLHPNQQIRRYAVANVDADGLWKVATPRVVPLAAILSMLEKVVGSNQFDENFQKLYFRTVHRRLLSITSRAELLYARGVARIFAQLPFFMEDEYFEKLMTTFDYLTAKEKQYKIADGMLDGYIEKLSREKTSGGRRETTPPQFASVPAVVLRKLARDGHFWYDLAMHPLFKIARETIRHINTQERALRIANNHLVSQDVLREVGKNRGLFHSLSAKLALLSNPRTPVPVSLNYLSDLGRPDHERLLRRNTVHPEIRQRLLERMRL